jgi:hypothetical protein
MRKFYLSVLCAMFLLSCGYQTGVIQKAEKGYIKFLGSWGQDEVTVKIDDREPFKPKPSDTNTLFEITPGKHSIQILRNDKIVVDRMIFLDIQATYEVKIP